MSKNYTKEICINKLVKKGLKPKYDRVTGLLLHFEQSENVTLGNKSWGMVDFLNISVYKKVRAVKQRRRIESVSDKN